MGVLALVPDTMRRTPSVTDARGFAVAAEDPASGDATDARGPGLAVGAAPGRAAAAGAAPLVLSVAERTGGVLVEGAAGVAAGVLPGTSDWRRVAGTGGGGMALDAGVVVEDGLAAGGFEAVAVPVLAAFFRAAAEAEDAGLETAGAAVVFAAVGVGLTVPEPNLPESMIWAGAGPERADGVCVMCGAVRARRVGGTRGRGASGAGRQAGR